MAKRSSAERSTSRSDESQAMYSMSSDASNLDVVAQKSSSSWLTNASPASLIGGNSGPEQAPPPIKGKPSPGEKSRLVFYEGYTTVRSTDPIQTLDSAILIVKHAGGYLENRMGLQATLRVPVAEFDSLFHRIMRLGEVVSFNQNAEDITEAYQNADLQLQLVLATLERLEALVQKAKTDSQKLLLLGQLKRLREDREVLEANKRNLAQNASFAAIHLQLQGHDPELGQLELKSEMADFRWMGLLDPFNQARFYRRSTWRFYAPTGMVVSQKRRPWRATGSEGTEFWGSRLYVNPLGDGRFWRESIRLRLKPGFKSVETVDSAGFYFCKFQSFGPNPYFYWVGVCPKKHKLGIVEFYFPNEAQQTQLLPAVLAAVGKGPVPWYSLF